MSSLLPSVLTIDEAAFDLQTQPPKIWKFHREGRLAIMYLAGKPTNGRKGAKDGRIDRQEWERFKRDLMMSCAPPEPAPEPEPVGRGRPSRASAPSPGGFQDALERKLRRSGRD